MEIFPIVARQRKNSLRGLASRNARWSRFRQSQAIRRGPLIPVLAAAVLLAGCIHGPGPDELGVVQDPCVETHDQGCVPEAEFVTMADAIASTLSETSSFENQWGLGAIRADQAYANLELQYGPDVAPGEGVLVGVLDTGIDAAHFQFRNKNIIQRFLPGSTGDDGSEFSHGTAVASIIAGEDDPDWPHDAHGVAWGADLAFFALPLGDAPETYDPITVDDLPEIDEFIREYIGTSIDWRYEERGIDFLNMSLAVSGLIQNFSEEDLREYLAPGLDLLAQEGSDEKVVLVWAAGNYNGLDCILDLPECVDGLVEARSAGLMAGLTARIPELRGHSVAVVAVRPDGEISDFSNHCGIAADYCLAAPGEDILVAYFGPSRDGRIGVRGTATSGGTSFAAPIVTGGLALMKHYFRSQLSNTDLLARLLRTANSSGPYADPDLYGRGLMDLGAATSPVGTSTVALGDQVKGPGAALGMTGLQLGQAFGDGLTLSLAGQEIAAFDALGAPFWYDFSRLAPVSETALLSERLRAFQRMPALAPQHPASDAVLIPLLAPPAGSAAPALPLRLAISGTSAAEAASHLAFRGHSLLATMPVTAGLTATAVTTEGVDGQDPASGAALSWRAPGALLGFRAGWMGERQALLGTDPAGAFGSLASNAVFAGIEAEGNLGPWQLSAAAEAGSVNARPRGGLFRNVSNISTSGFALRAARPAADGRAFRVSLSQPLRVEGGEALLAFPSGRTKAGEVVHSAVAAGLEPSGRQIDLAFEWQQPLDHGVLRLGATVSRQPGHRRDAEPELVLLSDWRLAF